MSNTSRGLIAGLAGALSLTLMHEVLRRIDPKAPRMDRLGMDAAAKLLKKTHVPVPEEGKLFGWTLTGDIVGNALFYGLAVMKSEQQMLQGAISGLAMGAGALVLPEKMGLKKEYSNRTARTKFLTVALYTIGGIVTSVTYKCLGKKR